MEWLQTAWGNNLFFALFGFTFGGLLTAIWKDNKCERCKRKCVFK